MIRRVALLVLFLIVGSCSGDLPSSSVAESHAERAFGILLPRTPIVSLMRDRDIRSPDISTPDMLVQLQRELAKSDPAGTYAGVTYDLTRGNVLAADWLVQTPNRWGRRADDLAWFSMGCKDCEPDISLPACSTDADCGGGTCTAIWPRTAGARAKHKVCLGHSDALVVRIRDLIATARQSVDIVALQPAPDGRFRSAMRSALLELAASRRRIEVRVLIGQYPPTGVDAAAFLKDLTKGLDDIAGARLSVSVAAMRSCTAFDTCNSFSWNHGKYVVVDGREALLGGHNFWTEDYLTDNPVHDLSMQVRGPAASSASRFADRLWRFVCDNVGQKASISLVSYSRGGGEPGDRCPPALAARRPPPAPGGVPVMAVGRLGSGITDDFANHSELARDLLFGAARKTILVAQQDLGFRLGRSDTLFPESALEEMVDLMMKHDGNVYVVLSNPGSIGNGGSPYFNDVPMEVLARRIKQIVQKRIDDADPKARYAVRRGADPVNALLCSRFHLAPLRFGPDDSWPGGKTIANHSKFWMVDGRAFYIGSDNMYPVNLQEFGLILDDPKAAATVLQSYWGPLWEWSRRAAVSGDGVENCVFREVRL